MHGGKHSIIASPHRIIEKLGYHSHNFEQHEVARGVPWGLRWRSSTFFIATSIFIGICGDALCFGLLIPMIPFRLQEIGYNIDDGSQVGWIMSSYAIGILIASPVVGLLGEKYPNRRIPLLLSLGLNAIATIIFMLTSTLTPMLIARVLQGVAGSSVWILGLALIAESSPRHHSASVIGYALIGSSVGAMAGPAIGGVLYSQYGYATPFIFALAFIGLDFACRFLLIEKATAVRYIHAGLIDIPGFEAAGYDADVSSEEKVAYAENLGKLQLEMPANGKLSELVIEAELAALPTLSKEASEIEGDEVKVKPVAKGIPWKAIGKLMITPRPVILLGCTFLDGLVGGVINTGLTVWLAKQYNLDVQGAGFVMIARAVPALFCSPLAGKLCDRYRSGAKWVTVAGLVMGVPGLALLFVKGPLGLLVFLLILSGAACSFFITPIIADFSEVAATTDDVGPAHVYALFNTFSSLGALVSPILCGQLIESLGIVQGWTVMTILSGAFSALLIPGTIIYVGGPLRRVKLADSEAIKAVEHADSIKAE